MINVYVIKAVLSVFKHIINVPIAGKRIDKTYFTVLAEVHSQLDSIIKIIIGVITI